MQTAKLESRLTFSMFFICCLFINTFNYFKSHYLGNQIIPQWVLDSIILENTVTASIQVYFLFE